MESELAQNTYFSTYEDLEVHQLMLEDGPRMNAYRQAILGNKSYFENKIVMDVGCGTGILALLCAQAGAQKVYAIEASNMANIAKELAKENNFCNVIEVIHSKVEDVTLPDNMKVDAIVSEWMGFYLLHEGMLNSVLVARDKFLKQEGRIFPETAAIYVAPCSVPSLFDKWKNYNGVSLTTFAKHLRAKKSGKPAIMQIQPDDLLGPDISLAWINLRDDSIDDLERFAVQHVVGTNKSGLYQGVCIWFECHFPPLANKEAVVLSTHPASPVTHWKQTVIILPEEVHVEEREPIAFKLVLERDVETFRRYEIEFSILDPDTIDHPYPCSCYVTRCILIKKVMDQQEKHLLNMKRDNERGDTPILLENNIDDDDDF